MHITLPNTATVPPTTPRCPHLQRRQLPAMLLLLLAGSLLLLFVISVLLLFLFLFGAILLFLLLLLVCAGLLICTQAPRKRPK